jgi:hypothetical protein
MKPEIKAKWIEALRSGEYAQGRLALRTDDGYCCLGVLCDLAAKAGVVEWLGDDEDEEPWDGKYLCYAPDDFNERENLVLPDSVAAWAGLEDKAPKVEDRWLATLNDHGKTFAEIADMIERGL